MRQIRLLETETLGALGMLLQLSKSRLGMLSLMLAFASSSATANSNLLYAVKICGESLMVSHRNSAFEAEEFIRIDEFRAVLHNELRLSI